MKEIAIVLKSLPMGGVEKVLINILNKFDYDEYKVTLWLQDDGLLKEQLNHSVEVKYWSNDSNRQILADQIERGEIFEVLNGIRYRILTRRYALDRYLNKKYAIMALPLLSDIKYDCVIAFQVWDIDILFTVCYRFMGKKKISWVHGECWYGIEKKKMLKELRQFDKVYCVSNYIKNSFVQIFPEMHDKTDVFYNILDKEEITLKSKKEINETLTSEFSLLTVGRLSKEKGQDFVPEVMKMLVDDGYDIVWYLVGDGPLRKQLEVTIRNYHLEKNIVLLGNKSNPYPYFQMVTIYVQTSRSEGWCLATQEARILNKPCVTTGVPVMREQFVNGKNGIISETISAKSLYESIKKMLDSTEIRNQCINNLRKDQSDNTNQLTSLYSFIEQ